MQITNVLYKRKQIPLKTIPDNVRIEDRTAFTKKYRFTIDQLISLHQFIDWRWLSLKYVFDRDALLALKDYVFWELNEFRRNHDRFKGILTNDDLIDLRFHLTPKYWCSDWNSIFTLDQLWTLKSHINWGRFCMVYNPLNLDASFYYAFESEIKDQIGWTISFITKLSRMLNSVSESELLSSYPTYVLQAYILRGIDLLSDIKSVPKRKFSPEFIINTKSEAVIKAAIRGGVNTTSPILDVDIVKDISKRLSPVQLRHLRAIHRFTPQNFTNEMLLSELILNGSL